MPDQPIHEDGEPELDGDRFDGLPYDEILDENGEPEAPVDIDDI